MKKLLFLSFITTLAFSLVAQPGREMKKPDVNTVMQHYQQILNLTEEQQKAIKPLIEKEMKVMEEFHSGNHNNPSDMAKIQQKIQLISEEIKSHLDKNQQVEYEKFREEMKENRGRDRGRRR
jgi:iron-sulfur cluster repair protein YtfE (RIC family)